jgi:thioredoxin 1
LDPIGYAVLAVVLGMLAMQVIPLVRARRARGRPVPELDALLDAGQRGKPRLLVYFWSPACGMCRSMTPVIDRLAVERGDVVKVSVAESLDLARRFGVMGTPSVALVKDGVLEKLVVGARSEAQLRALLEAR